MVDVEKQNTFWHTLHKKINHNLENEAQERVDLSQLCFLFLQNATLKELNVCRGDTLVITEGKLPPKVKINKLCPLVR